MSFPRYPRYKDTGVEWLGEVPEHWTMPPLYLRYEVMLGKMLDTKKLTGAHAVPYVRNVDVQWDSVNVRDLPDIDIAPTERDRFTLRAGDVLVCEGGEVGRAAIWQGELDPCAFQKAIHRLRPLTPNEDPRYLFHCLRLASETGVFIAHGNPNTIPHLTGEAFRLYRLPSPPRGEQSVIAAFLDRETAKIDQLVEEQGRLVALLQEKRQAAISHAVTKGLNPDAPMKASGVEWLGDVPAHWEIRPLRHFPCMVQTGPFGSQLHAEEYVTGETPVINPVHMIEGCIIPSNDVTVREDVVRRLQHQRLRIGDVIFSRRGELGRCALVTETEDGWLCGTGSMILRMHDSQYLPAFLSRYLSLELLRQYFESFSIGAIMDSLSSATLLSMPMVVPPIEEQARVVADIDAESSTINTLTTEAQHAIDLLLERRAALISAAVTGQIDVRAVVAA